MTKVANSGTYSWDGLRNRYRRVTSMARYTETRMPANTSAFTNHVVPNSSAKCTMFVVSSNRNAAPMKNRSR